MGTALEKPDVEICLDSSDGRAFVRLHLDVNIPRARYLELATLMDLERFDEAEALMLELHPDAAAFLDMFFSREIRHRSKPARQAA